MAEITLDELNLMVTDNVEKMIKDAEELYKSKVLRVANRITENENTKLIFLAGPSGSGKTTTANLIRDAVIEKGEDATVISLDDFYRDHDDPEYPRLENGERDYECPESLDLGRLAQTMKRIVNDEEFEIPKYDFKVGKCISTKKHPPLGHGCVIIEGLHALNPKISDFIPKDKTLKIFVSVSTNINHEERRILSGRKLRFIRRLVRDSIYRGAGVERTRAMWQGVLCAEDIYLYPYKTTADIAFNTFHTFELGVMKSFVEKLIPKSIAAKDEYLDVVLRAVTLAEGIDYHKIPTSSLIREFVPGGIYESLY